MSAWLEGVVLSVGVVAVRLFKYFVSAENKIKPFSDAAPLRCRLGSFVVWGRPNVGKTTFIARLRGENLDPAKKSATTSRAVYTDVKVDDLKGGNYLISEIVDMPGTEDRLNDWLKAVAEKDHVFYMINLSRSGDAGYVSRIREDVKATIKALRDSNKKEKGRRIHIIASHVDESKWKDEDVAQVNNILQDDPEMRLLYESLEDVSGYVYCADLTNEVSFKRLLQSIVDDCES